MQNGCGKTGACVSIGFWCAPPLASPFPPHSGGNPASRPCWVPAFAGMTLGDGVGNMDAGV